MTKRVQIRKDVPTKRRPFRIVSIMDAKPESKPARRATLKTDDALNMILDALDAGASPKLVPTNPAVAELLGMTTRQVVTQARKLPPTGLLTLITALSDELRRLNALAADGEDSINGPNAQADLTAGEQGTVGLSKNLGQPGAAAIVDVLHTQAEVEARLQAVIELHEERARNAPVNDGEIRSSRPFNGMSLDAVEKYAERQARIAERLRNQPDGDFGAAALGVSPDSQRGASQVAKSSAPVPRDSYAGQNDLAASIAKAESQRLEVAPPWYMRTRR